MIPHLKKSRMTKVFTDRAEGDVEFEVAEEKLAAITVGIVISAEQTATPAGQAAVLTAAATAVKCFGKAVLVGPAEAVLPRSLPVGRTLGEAARSLGADLSDDIPSAVTHVVCIGSGQPQNTFIRCWWDFWSAGVVPAWDTRPYGNSANPLAGIFAGALAIREIFAAIAGSQRAGNRVSVISLWQPWSTEIRGPARVYLPPMLWFVGLGHLGQGFLWSLGFLPVQNAFAVLQDDQTVGEENEATGLLTTIADVGAHKTRVAARWLENLGWRTALLERRNYGDVRLLSRDPAVVLTSIDEPIARADIAKAGFEYMIDAGVGRGPVDFESAQIRVLRKGSDPKRFWSAPETPKDVDALMLRRAYKVHARKSDNCGTFTIAEASIAVPFVGAAVGALTIAQLLRLGHMMETPKIMQADLASPELLMTGGMNGAPISGLGGIELSVG
jgi:hypothetical protein